MMHLPDPLPPRPSTFNPMDVNAIIGLLVRNYAGGRAAFTQEDLDDSRRIVTRQYWEKGYWIVAATDQRGS